MAGGLLLMFKRVARSALVADIRMTWSPELLAAIYIIASIADRVIDKVSDHVHGMPHVLVMAARLPAPPAGQTYYVWLSQAGQPQLVGELGLNQGFGALVFDADLNGGNHRILPAGANSVPCFMPSV